jgi:predicted CXXCH cytochrome family protein
MKSLRVGLAFLAGASLLLIAGGTPQAFHSGGVAECGGCHSMHGAPTGGSFLLIATDPSSTCLSCHMHAGDTGPSSYHIATADADMPTGVAPLQKTPGGDFGWLRKSYTMTIRGTTSTEAGQTHGHNIVALDTSFNVPDSDNTVSPGGSFSASQLGCESCHDPHGRARRLSDGTYANAVYTAGSTNAPIIASGSYDNSITPASGQAVGVYRLLRGLGDNSQGVTFSGVAIAIAPATYNRKEDATQTRVAYGHSGSNTWGAWCGTCHEEMHDAAGNNRHPIDENLGDIATAYNAYVKSGDLTGSAASSFTSLVPFVENTGTITTLQSHAKNNDSYLNGPSQSDRVSCLSCHRAHASGWPEALRWNMEGEFMIYNSLYPGTDTTPTVPQFARGRLGAETQAAYYDRPVTKFASYQRVLCNKCHAKD